MKILIVGATGILGRAVLAEAQRRKLDFVTTYNRRRPGPQGVRLALTDARSVFAALRAVQPDLVINCAGLTKGLCGAVDLAWRVNALGPRLLASAASEVGARLVHVSTDCIFRGDRGPYAETAEPDARDTYGQSKAQGEITASPHLTVRSSFVGFESPTAHGLLAWFLEQRGEIAGYRNHLWSGVTAPFLAETLLDLAPRRDVTGVLHVAGEHVTKAELLRLFQERFQRSVTIDERDADVPVDRRLAAPRLRALGITVPRLADLIAAFKEDESCPSTWKTSTPAPATSCSTSSSATGSKPAST